MIVIIKNFFALLKRALEPGSLNKKTFLSEDDFYEEMFTKDSDWSGAEPNVDELSRWEKIENFCDLIKDEQKASLAKIIDVGCGRGWLSQKLTKYGKVTGIEPVKSVVVHAKSLFKTPTFFDLTPDNFIELYPREKFDLVVCSEVLEHVVEKDNFVSSLNKLLKKGGFLILTTPRGELREFWEKKYSVPPQPIEMWISTEDLKKMLDSRGFYLISSTTAFSDDIYQIHLLKKK